MPIVTGQAATLSGTTFLTAVQTGNVAGAFGALANAPAVTLGGTQFGGLIPGLQGASADLPTAITPLT